MKTNIATTFYADYSGTVNRLLDAIDTFKRLNKSYTAVALGDLITNGSDFGVSAVANEELLPFFTDLKEITTTVIASMNEHVNLDKYYATLGLSSVIEDAYEFDDGNTGADLKSCLSSMEALETELTSAFHYTNLCRMEYTAKKYAATWDAGITGTQVKAVITSLGAIDTFLTAGFHYTNLNKLI
jgi:hypothetical protein